VVHPQHINPEIYLKTGEVGKRWLDKEIILSSKDLHTILEAGSRPTQQTWSQLNVLAELSAADFQNELWFSSRRRLGLGKSLAEIGLPEPTERQQEVEIERLRWSGDLTNLCAFKDGLTPE
jgi:hypothetical protein